MHKPDYYGSINALLFFGVGGLGALWSSGRSAWSIPRWMQYILLIVFLSYSLELVPGIAPSFSGISDLVLALGCLFIILSATARQSIFNLENSVIKKFGQISYGIYVFHTFIAYGVLRLIAPYFVENGVLLELGYPLLVVVLTIGISLLSYRFYESPFLRLKNRL
jgi:peptidoglycan/LPS O-acetylase OafA/YrhL